MCGLLGLFSQHPIDPTLLAAMTDSMTHRGPDSQGLEILNLSDTLHIGLGHRRLSILDLSPKGAQPMTLLDRYKLIFNGEIFNFIELKAELEALGYPIHTGTDTEIIALAYHKWGVQALSKFNGMWAFVLLDTQTQTVLISRDRFGVKPLYTYHNPDTKTWICASEIKAILAHPSLTPTPNLTQCQQYLDSGPAEHQAETCFEGITRFPAASYWEGPADRLLTQPIKPQLFWTLPPPAPDEIFDPQKAETLAKTYRDLLTDAVRLRLRADVPIGSALSGGLDSASIVYLVNQLLHEANATENQKTFSCVYHHPDAAHCDESPYIQRLAKDLNLNAFSIEPNPDDIPQRHPQLITALECPPNTTLQSSWHTFHLVSQTFFPPQTPVGKTMLAKAPESQFIARHGLAGLNEEGEKCDYGASRNRVTVTLDGQGADEQLGGYAHNVMFYLANTSPQAAFGQALAFWKNSPNKGYVTKGLACNLLKTLLGPVLASKLIKIAMPKVNPYVDLNAYLQHEFLTKLPNLLHYADATSMAFSIESRMPFMDYRLVNFLATVPACYKMHEGWTKWLARKAFNGLLPDDIVWRKSKMGWPVPEDAWFSGPLQKWLASTLQASRFITQFKTQSTPVRRLNLALWHQIFFETK